MKNNTSGFILVSMVMMMLVIALTAMTMNRRAGMGDRMSANHVHAIRTRFGEDAAMAYALWKLKNDPDFRTAPAGEAFSFDGLDYTLTVLTSPLGGYEDVVRISASPSGGTTARTLGIRIAQPPNFTGVYLCDTDNVCVRGIDPGTGLITTVAGIPGASGYNGDNIPATTSRLKSPQGAQEMSNGDIYIADTLNHRIRKVDGATGIITTIAGNGSLGFAGDGGPAVNALLKDPRGIHHAPQPSGPPILTLVNEIY